MIQSPRSYSLVLEMENAALIEWKRVGEMLRAVTTQIAEQTATSPSEPPQVVCVHAGPPEDDDMLRQMIAREAPQLTSVAKLQCHGLPEGRYYELKNRGLAKTTNDVVILLDSDTIPEPGWLAAMLKPFEEPSTVAAGGLTCLDYDTLVSRTLAIVWIFPLRSGDLREVNRRPLYANNSAYRGDWFRANPYPIDDGFKVACTRHMQMLCEQGIKPVLVPAYTIHAPLRGFRFLAWRAWVTGKDADRKIVALKGHAPVRRLLRALRHGLKMEARAIRRILAHFRSVAIPWWQVPAALLMAMMFYAVMFVAQVAHISGLLPQRAERVPAFVENS